MATLSRPKAETTNAPSTRDIEAIVRSVYEAFNERKLERAGARMASDCEWTDIPSGMVMRGPDGYLGYDRGWLAAFPDGRIEVLNVLVAGELACVEFIGRGTHTGPFRGPDGQLVPPSQNRIELRLTDMITVKGGKIVRGRTYYDAFSLLRQITQGPPRTEAIVRRPGEGTPIWMLDGLYEVKVSAKESAGAITVMEMTLPEGKGPPVHTHECEETVFVIEGRLSYTIGGKEYEGGPGTIFHAPRGTLEGFVPKERCRVLVAYAPGGMDAFFLEAGERAPHLGLPPPSTAPVDVARLVEIGAKFGLRIATGDNG